MSINHSINQGWRTDAGGRVLSAFLALAIIGALGMLIYFIASPGSGERFTEFYILGLEGEAKDYPELLGVGEEGEVVVGIINREQETTTYRLEVRIGGVINDELALLTLENSERWEGIVGFTPGKAGDTQKVEFLLYKQGQSEVYRKLHLWLDVP